MKATNSKHPAAIGLAIVFTITAIALGYFALGIVPAFIFTFGYLGGLLLWLPSKKKPPFKAIAAPYFITLLLFILHKSLKEEKN